MSLSLLLQEIERKRALMMRAANQHGYSAKITIKYSQELDRLLAEYSSLSEGISRSDRSRFNTSAISQ